MIDKKKQDESIRQSDYLSAVLMNKESEGNLFSKLYLPQTKPRINRSSHLLDARSRSNIGDCLLQKKGLLPKRYAKIKKQCKTCIEQMKITPFQNWKMQEKSISQKKLTVINKNKAAPKELERSKQKWLIVQELESSTESQSVKKLLQLEIKRIKFGIQNMRQQIQTQQTQRNPSISNQQQQEISTINAGEKAVAPFSQRKMGKQRIKRNYYTPKMHQNVHCKIKNQMLKQINKANKQKDRLNNLCVLSRKYMLVNPQNNKSFDLISKPLIQSSTQHKRFKHHQCSCSNKPEIQIVDIYLNNSKILKDKQQSSLEVELNHNQLYSDPTKRVRQRKIQKVIGWESGNRDNCLKQMYL